MSLHSTTQEKAVAVALGPRSALQTSLPLGLQEEMRLQLLHHFQHSLCNCYYQCRWTSNNLPWYQLAQDLPARVMHWWGSSTGTVCGMWMAGMGWRYVLLRAHPSSQRESHKPDSCINACQQMPWVLSNSSNSYFNMLSGRLLEDLFSLRQKRSSSSLHHTLSPTLWLSPSWDSNAVVLKGQLTVYLLLCNGKTLLILIPKF